MHPLDAMISEIEKDPKLAYTIVDNGKPVAVVISPELFNNMNHELVEVRDGVSVVESTQDRTS